MMMGTAAATLTGLMFVATMLFVGLDTHEAIANAGISAYNTPIVVQFCAVLPSTPWQTFSTLRFLLGLLGVAMVINSIIILRRMWRMPHYQSTLEDWSWYLALPLLANVTLIVAALMFPTSPSVVLYIIGSAMLLLLILLVSALQG